MNPNEMEMTVIRSDRRFVFDPTSTNEMGSTSALERPPPQINTDIDTRRVIHNPVGRLFIKFTEAMSRPIMMAGVTMSLNFARTTVKSFGSEFSEKIVDAVSYGMSIAYFGGIAWLYSYKSAPNAANPPAADAAIAIAA